MRGDGGVMFLWQVVVAAAMWGPGRGELYGAPAVPQYGALHDYPAPLAHLDYAGHSPDAAPPPLDYKYDEDVHGNIEKVSNDVEITEHWQKPTKKRRARLRHDKDDLDFFSSQTTESLYKLNRRYLRNKSRVKSEKSRRHRFGMRVVDDNDDRPRSDDDYSLSNEYRSHKKNDDRFLAVETTQRIIRRKARDRHNLQSYDTDLDDLEQEKEEDSEEEEGRRRLQPSDYEDEDELYRRKPTRRKSKPYHEYYYDMERVYNIKNRLPVLLRRTTMHSLAVLDATDTSSYMKAFWTARRMAPTIFSTKATIVSNNTGGSDSTTTATSTTTSTITTTTTATPSFSITTKYLSSSIPNQSAWAENSRLTILKKALRKETNNDFVTSKIPTVVMVDLAPESSERSWMLVSEALRDSPEKLEKVKSFMRHKLVADSKNIRQLNDNWDELVCEYVDMDLINAAHRSGNLHLIMTTLISLLSLYNNL